MEVGEVGSFCAGLGKSGEAVGGGEVAPLMFFGRIMVSPSQKIFTSGKRIADDQPP